MASLKFYLDTRRALANGSYPLKLRVSVHGDGAYIATDIKLKQSNWDANKQQAKGLPNKDKINSYLRSFMVNVENALLDLRIQGKGRGLSAVQLRDILLLNINGKDKSEKILFVDYFARVIDTKKNATTKRMYSNTLMLLKRIDTNIDSMYMDDVSEKYLRDILIKLDNDGHQTNSICIYFSHIGFVLRSACDEELITINPMARIKIRKEKTIKRNLVIEDLRAVLNTNLPGKSAWCIDIFRLTFFLIGINSVDLYNMRSEALQDGRINYIRAKTHKLYSIKVEPEALSIINKYRGEEYLFNFSKKYTSHNSFVSAIDASLKRNIDNKLTIYYARHSWATIAHSIGIDKDTISLALGHSFGVSVTDTYIDYNAEKVDAANRRVLDWVLYGKK